MNTVLTILPKGVLTNDNDPDGNTLIAILVTNPVHGIVVLKNDGSFTYTPVNGYIGTDSFTYKANDGLTNSNIAAVTLTVTKK
jgi:VCBS repeat-containing protein